MDTPILQLVKGWKRNASRPFVISQPLSALRLIGSSKVKVWRGGLTNLDFPCPLRAEWNAYLIALKNDGFERICTLIAPTIVVNYDCPMTANKFAFRLDSP